jgi:sulfur-carrier protein
MATVTFTSGFARKYTGGVREFEVEATNLRGVLREMDRLFPGLGHALEEETNVAINGELHETGYFQPVPPEAKVFFIPRIEGG